MLNHNAGGRITRGSLYAVVAVVTLVLAAGAAQAQQNVPVTFEVSKATGNLAKIDSVLTDVMGRAKTSAKPSELSSPLAKVDGTGAVQVYVCVTDCSKATLQGLAAAGLKVELVNAELKMIQGWIAISALKTLADNPLVTGVRTPGYRKLRAGAVMTEGDAVIKASYPRLSGDRGAGIKIGLISDGVNSRAAAQATGDLPATITIDPARKGDGDAGTALLEIVHDVAPLSSLAFSGPTTSLEFISSLNYLVAQGCSVIFDDLGFYDQPYFEDGPVAAAVAGVLSQVCYLSAAGNDAQFHYAAQYVDVDPAQSGGTHDFHAFSGGDVSMQVLIPGYSTVEVTMEWSDKWGQAADDYDLYLYNGALTTILAQSSNTQNGTQNPYEVLTYTNFKSTPLVTNILINKHSGAAKKLELFVNGAQEIQFPTAGGSVFGQAAVNGVISVGAVNVKTPSTIAAYSSQGPRSIVFPSASTRNAPTIVAPDGVSVTGAGGYPKTFYGTSAAVAHAAGVAALIMSAHADYSLITIYNTFAMNTTDLGTAGLDNIYGYGLIDADRAINLPHNAVKHWNEFR